MPLFFKTIFLEFLFVLKQGNNFGKTSDLAFI